MMNERRGTLSFRASIKRQMIRKSFLLSHVSDWIFCTKTKIFGRNECLEEKEKKKDACLSRGKVYIRNLEKEENKCK